MASSARHDHGPLDVIGDIHGYADKLSRLLAAMGYREQDGSWTHPERRAVFIGDLIDRGPAQLDTIRTVRAMVDAGTALIVMGNHEYNAIAWATAHPERPDEYLRARHGEKGAKNRAQHERFLAEAGEDSQTHLEIIDWFKTIPLWCDLGGVRFVHACWDPAAIERLAWETGPANTLTAATLVSSTTEGDPLYVAIETLLKGPEVALPAGYEYLDKDGHRRDHARYAWWKHDADTYRGGLVVPDGVTTLDGASYPELPCDSIPAPPSEPYRDSVPLFVGHYWRTGRPEILSEHVACVDYSAGKGGPLVAYRWDGETRLSSENFVLQH